MKNLKRMIFILLSVVAVATAASGGYAVMQARSQYYGVCSRLGGFPGLLQQAGLLQTGTCVSKPGGTLCNSGGSCTVGGKAGTCYNTAKPGGTPICTCVAGASPLF